MRFWVSIFLSVWAVPLLADIVDLTRHTQLKGAYLLHQPEAEFVSVQLVLNVGEADFDGPEGLAHYLEHLVWYSADKAHEVAAKNRIANAWTNTLFTTYWNRSSPAKIDDMLAASARVFAPIELRPSFARTELDVVRREYDLRTRDNAKWRLYDKMYKALMPGHGLARSTIGTPESLARITPELSAAFKQLWYKPNNATLLISGPVRPALIRPLLERHFKDIPTGDVPQRPWLEPITWDGRLVDVTLDHPKATEPFFSIYFKAALPENVSIEQGYHIAEVLGALLNSSTPGSPRQKLYYADFTLAWIEAYVWADQAGTINLAFEGAAEEGVLLEVAIDATLQHFDDMTALSDESFAKVRKNVIETTERTKDRFATAQDIAFAGILERGAPYTADEYLQALKAVTLEDLERMMRTLQQNSIIAVGIAQSGGTE